MLLTTRKRTGLAFPDLADLSWFPFVEPVIRIEEFHQDDRYVVRAEIPGIDPAKDVDIVTKDGYLRLVVVRLEETKEQGRTEFRYGTFHRTIALPPLLAREVEGLPLYQLSGIPIACEAVEGRPAEVLVRAARDADLLVLGSHGYGRQIHQVLGSVTEECIRNATCPVVVLPTGYQHRDTHNSGGQLAEVQ